MISHQFLVWLCFSPPPPYSLKLIAADTPGDSDLKMGFSAANLHVQKHRLYGTISSNPFLFLNSPWIDWVNYFFFWSPCEWIIPLCGGCIPDHNAAAAVQTSSSFSFLFPDAHPPQCVCVRADWREVGFWVSKWIVCVPLLGRNGWEEQPFFLGHRWPAQSILRVLQGKIHLLTQTITLCPDRPG